MTTSGVGPSSSSRIHHAVDRSVEDWRTDAQTDIDRISYAPEFRRLSGVTQVVPPQEDYIFHDRLTHSIKVAQVAATIARKILHESDGDLGGIQLADWIDPDYCYAAGLAHDIGHPPFGHAGKIALQRKLDQITGLSVRSFEGNAQSTRIVANLSFRKQDQPGLNLTLRSLAAIAKYPWLRDHHPSSIPKLAKKWSFYPEEAHLLQRLLDEGYVAAESRPAPDSQLRIVERVYRWPEAQIMDWADDISYAVHDMEDFFRAGRIPLHRIAAALRRAPEAYWGERRNEWSTTSFEFAGDDDEVRAALEYARSKMKKHLDERGQGLEDQIPAAFAELGASLLRKLPTARFDGSRRSHTALQKFGSEAIQYLSSKTQIAVIEASGQRRIHFSVDPTGQLVAEFFKAICQFYVIETSAVATMQYGQTRSIGVLVDGLHEMALRWIESQQERPQRDLPARLREYLAERMIPFDAVAGSGGQPNPQEIKDAAMLAVIDFVCGMRDLQATLLVTRLQGHRESLAMSASWLDT